jgi:CrcB protein
VSRAGLYLAVPLAGGLGAALRFVVDSAVRTRWTLPTRGGRVWPVGILLVNVTGSFVLGLLTGLALVRGRSDWVVIVGVGLLGGYTTFSTASVDAVLLAREGSRGAAWGYVVATVTGAVAAAACGLALAIALTPTA